MSAADPALGLRERHKAKRRDAVLDAALDLLDGPDAAAATTERIAERAEVAVATVYNLVGTREQLLLALLDRVVAEVVESLVAAGPTGDPLDTLRALTEHAVAVLTRRPQAYRRVVLQLSAMAGGGTLHTKLSPATAAAGELRRAQQAGLLRSDLDADALAAQVYLSFNGALLRWAAGALTDAGLRAAALHGLTVVLVAAGTASRRRASLAELRALGAELTRAATPPPVSG